MHRRHGSSFYFFQKRVNGQRRVDLEYPSDGDDVEGDSAEFSFFLPLSNSKRRRPESLRAADALAQELDTTLARSELLVKMIAHFFRRYSSGVNDVDEGVAKVDAELGGQSDFSLASAFFNTLSRHR